MNRNEAIEKIRPYYPIHVTLNGSEAYGTSIGTSDLDLMGVTVPPLDHYFGLASFGSRGTKEIRDGDLDAVLYEATKAISLLKGQNPNTMTALWVNPDDILYTTEAGSLLVAKRHLFLSKGVSRTFYGYAQSQLKKLGDSEAPTGNMGAKRKATVEEYGYDTKNAMHLIRILRMGREILSTGEVRVDRRGIDADELMAIRCGEWSLDRIRAEADDGFDAINAAEDATELPDEPDWDAINELCVQVVSIALGIEA